MKTLTYIITAILFTSCTVTKTANIDKMRENMVQDFVRDGTGKWVKTGQPHYMKQDTVHLFLLQLKN